MNVNLFINHKTMEASEQLRNFQQLKQLKFNDEKYKTSTSIDQVNIDCYSNVLVRIETTKIDQFVLIFFYYLVVG